MVTDDQNVAVVAGQRDDFAGHAVEHAIEIAQRLLPASAGHVRAVLRIMVAPEDVLRAIKAHVDVEREIPGLGAQAVAQQPVLRLCHVDERLQQTGLVPGAKVRHVEAVVGRELQRFLAEDGGPAAGAAATRRQRPAEQVPAHGLHRPGLRQSHDQAVTSGRAQQVVYARQVDCGAVRQALLQIFTLFTLTKAVDAQFARVASAQHAGPGWHGDAGDAGAQFAPGALPSQPA